jgi:hypothetical protein
MKSEHVVTPGTFNRILADAPRFLPRAAVLTLAASISSSSHAAMHATGLTAAPGLQDIRQ